MRAARRRAVQSGYRALLSAALQAEGTGSSTALLPNDADASLVGYVRHRVREELENTTRAEALAAANAGKRGRTAMPRKSFERRVATMHAFADALMAVDDIPEVAACTRALSLGYGGEAYRRAVEEAALAALQFRIDRQERRAADADAEEHHQNMALLHALLPFAEKLSVMHRDDVDADVRATLMTPRRSTTRGQHVDMSVRHTEALHVDVDDELGKQTIYVRTRPMELGVPDNMVEAREVPSVRRSSAHAEWSLVAERFVDTLLSETAVHASRATTIVGHGVGGAVATVMGLLLHSQGFVVRNVVTFGAPMSFSELLERDELAINVVRVELAGDPRVGLPTSDDDGRPFRHLGEKLVIEVEGNDVPDAAQAPPQTSTSVDDEAAASSASVEERMEGAEAERAATPEPCPMAAYAAAMASEAPRIYYADRGDVEMHEPWSHKPEVFSDEDRLAAFEATD